MTILGYGIAEDKTTVIVADSVVTTSDKHGKNQRWLRVDKIRFYPSIQTGIAFAGWKGPFDAIDILLRWIEIGKPDSLLHDMNFVVKAAVQLLNAAWDYREYLPKNGDFSFIFLIKHGSIQCWVYQILNQQVTLRVSHAENIPPGKLTFYSPNRCCSEELGDIKTPKDIEKEIWEKMKIKWTGIYPLGDSYSYLMFSANGTPSFKTNFNSFIEYTAHSEATCQEEQKSLEMTLQRFCSSWKFKE